MKTSMKTRLGVAAAFAIVAGGTAIALAPSANAAAGCSVTYTTNQWTGGFQGNPTITNLGDALSTWTVTFSFTAGQTLTQAWNATYSQSGANVTLTAMSYNGSLPTNGSVAPGFLGNWSGSNPAPTNWKLNGVACTGATTGTSAAPTSAAPTTRPPTSAPPTTGTANRPPTISLLPTPNSPIAPGSIGLLATASDPDAGDSVTKVEFYSGTTLLNTDTTSPYSYNWSGIPAGSYTISAKAYDTHNAVGTSSAMTFTIIAVSPSPTVSTNPGSAPALHVSGNKLLTSTGATYRLLGVNRSGGEFACIKNRDGIWNGPMDQASVTAMRNWKIRTVRVPLNEECWLGTSSGVAAYSGANYQAAVKDYTNLLISNGITPILEMHWNWGQYTGNSSGCSDTIAVCQKPMPDAQYAPQFWTSLANAFKDNRVLFDLFNEPYPERATGDATSGWKCWRDGGTCNGIGYQVAGFQSLVNAVRATGNTNVIMVGGLAYSNDASQMLTYLPNDPLKNLMGFAHIYNFNSCSSTSCYDSTFGAVAAQIPFALTEIGENDCGHSFIDTIMNWADAKGIGYLGWTWNNWDCSTGPSLISDYNGTATNFGQGLKTRLASVSN